MQLNIGCKIKFKKKEIFYVMLSMLRHSLTFFVALSVMYEVIKTILKLDNP